MADSTESNPPDSPANTAGGTDHAGGTERTPPDTVRRPRRTRALLVATALVAALTAGAGGFAVVASTTTPSDPSDNTATIGTGQVAATGTTTDISAVAEQVLPSVVQVNAETAGGESVGSGVVLTADGTILTNAHVVEGATGEITVTLSDGNDYRATVLGADTRADIAVLRATGANDLTPAKLGDSDSVTVGEQVVAIGSPGGLRNTVTSGIVSAVGRDLSQLRDEQPSTPFDRTSNSPSYTAIQTDAAINHGNSGGPLVNGAGEVIGINSAMYSPSGSGSIGIGFAIPSNDARTVAQQIENGV